MVAVVAAVAVVAVVAAVVGVVPGLGVVVDAVDLPQQQRAERGNFGLNLSLRVSAMILSSLVRGRSQHRYHSVEAHNNHQRLGYCIAF